MTEIITRGLDTKPEPSNRQIVYGYLGELLSKSQADSSVDFVEIYHNAVRQGIFDGVFPDAESADDPYIFKTLNHNAAFFIQLSELSNFRKVISTFKKEESNGESAEESKIIKRATVPFEGNIVFDSKEVNIVELMEILRIHKIDPSYVLLFSPAQTTEGLDYARAWSTHPAVFSEGAMEFTTLDRLLERKQLLIGEPSAWDYDLQLVEGPLAVEQPA